MSNVRRKGWAKWRGSEYSSVNQWTLDIRVRKRRIYRGPIVHGQEHVVVVLMMVCQIARCFDDSLHKTCRISSNVM